MIQAQYDKSLENPPWEHTNTFDIDDRPRKRKRPSYFYEVVAPDGNVVAVIDEEEKPSSQSSSNDGDGPPLSNLLPPSSPLSTRSTTPSLDLSDFYISSHYRSVQSASSVGSSAGENDSPFVQQDVSMLNSSPQPKPLKLPTSDTKPRQPKRKRAVTACQNCRRRKVKCDSNTPCSACVLSHLECGGEETEVQAQSKPACEPKPTRRSMRSSMGPFTSDRNSPSLVDSGTDAGTSFFMRSPKREINTSFPANSTTSDLNSAPSEESRTVLPHKRRQTLQREASSFMSSPSDEELSTQSSQPSVLPHKRRQTLQKEASSFMSSPSDEEPSTQSSQTSSRSLPNLKGRDLFDSMVWQDPFTTSIFYMFISSLRQKIQNEVTTTTETHNFIRTLRDGGRLVRNYTQNIDCLEERLGLCTNLTRGPGHRARFHSRTQREPRPETIDEQSAHNGGVEVVLLHGSLVDLRCGLCGKISSWSEADRESATLSGQAPDCPSCTEYNAHRTGRGRRELAVGRLRPDIVLYGEEHPHANLVGPLITHDIGLGPDVLLIMGTSLKVHGLKIMVKEFAKAVHSRGGTVVFVNRTKPPESTWGDVIDYWVEWDCDAWVLDLKQRREDIWSPQGTIEEPKKRQSLDTRNPRESLGETKPRARPQCMRDDKTNGAWVTFKILDALRMFPDGDGNIAPRPSHPDKFATNKFRSSLAANKEPHIENPLPLTKTTIEVKKNLPAPKRKTKSMSAVTSLAVGAAPRGKKRQSMPSKPTRPKTTNAKGKQVEGRRDADHDEGENEQREKDVTHVADVMAQWKKLRVLIPTMPKMPPKEALEIFKRNLNTNANRYAFYSTSNHIPNLGGWDIKGMNLLTHPPSGVSLPSIQDELPPARSELPPPPVFKPPTHAYSTRSSRRLAMTSNSEQTPSAWSGVNEGRGTVIQSMEPTEESLPTPPASGASSDPITPTSSSQRIKRMGSIGAILSSPAEDSSGEVWHDASEVLA